MISSIMVHSPSTIIMSSMRIGCVTSPVARRGASAHNPVRQMVQHQRDGGRDCYGQHRNRWDWQPVEHLLDLGQGGVGLFH